MPEYKYRDLKPTPEAEEVYRRWLRFLNEEFTKHKEPKLRNELVRDTLHQLLFARPHGGKLNFPAHDRTALQLRGAFARSGEHHAGAGVLRRHRRAEIRRTQAAYLSVADVRPLAAGAEPLAGIPLPLRAGLAHLQIAGQEREDVSWHRVLIRLQPDDRGQLHHPQVRDAG